MNFEFYYNVDQKEYMSRLVYVLRVIVFIYLCTFNSNKSSAQGDSTTSSEKLFSNRIIADGLEDPWTLIYGPDNHLWITEAKGYRVLRIDPVTGKQDTLADLNSVRQFPRYDTINDNVDGGKPWAQGGLMGMALHPELFKGKPFVYVVFVYDYEGKSRAGKGEHSIDGGFHFLTRIVRFDYHSTTKKLTNSKTICDSIPGSNDHNGGRLLIATIDNKSYLFYSIGDLGAGQFANSRRTNHAQDTAVYEGKLLRFELEPRGAGSNVNDWIPVDNPFNGNTHNAVWTLGHRNPQGLTKINDGRNDIIYSSEHGPFSDDEINIIQKGKNYGHPFIVGYTDGNYDGLAAGVTNIDSLPGKWNTSYPLITSERGNARKLPGYQDPIKSFYPTSNKLITSMAEKIRTGNGKDPKWNSLAPSGISAYTSDAIPGWKYSLLITSLKQGKIVRLKLDATRRRVIDEQSLFSSKARYRDVAVSADGTKIYIVTDKSVVTSGPTQKDPAKPVIHGALIEYTYLLHD